MPKTRRAGRKYQLRRLHAQLFCPATAERNAYVGVDYPQEQGYEDHPSPSHTPVASPSEVPAQLPAIPERYRLIPIYIGAPRCSVPRASSPRDPRPGYYKCLHAEILHSCFREATVEPVPDLSELRARARTAVRNHQRTATWVHDQTSRLRSQG